MLTLARRIALSCSNWMCELELETGQEETLEVETDNRSPCCI